MKDVCVIGTVLPPAGGGCLEGSCARGKRAPLRPWCLGEEAGGEDAEAPGAGPGGWRKLGAGEEAGERTPPPGWPPGCLPWPPGHPGPCCQRAPVSLGPLP